MKTTSEIHQLAHAIVSTLPQDVVVQMANLDNAGKLTVVLEKAVAKAMLSLTVRRELATLVRAYFAPTLATATRALKSRVRSNATGIMSGARSVQYSTRTNSNSESALRSA